LHGKTRAEEAIVERHIPERHGARGGMPDCLTELEILEKIAQARFGGRQRTHKSTPFSSARPFSQKREPNASFQQRETDEDVFGPCDSGGSALKTLLEDIL
jgi:hypothetical protein